MEVKNEVMMERSMFIILFTFFAMFSLCRNNYLVVFKYHNTILWEVLKRPVSVKQNVMALSCEWVNKEGKGFTNSLLNTLLDLETHKIRFGIL